MINIKTLKGDFEVLKNQHNNFFIKDGLKKILISCPHSVPQTRNGEIKDAEPETAIIALELSKLGYPCIIKTTNENDDANRDLNIPYKNDMLKFINNNDIKFVIDLHQLNSNREMDICLGTGNENHKNLLHFSFLTELIKKSFEDNKLITTINNPFSAKNVRTISGFSSSNNIPAIQIEINSRCVSGLNLEKFDSVVKSILQVLNIIENEISNEKEK